MIGNHGYQVILGNVLKNSLMQINMSEAYFAMKEEVSSEVANENNTIVYLVPGKHNQHPAR